MNKLFFIILLIFLINFTYAQIVFETNFDNIPDFESVELYSNDTRCTFDASSGNVQVPTYVGYSSNSLYHAAPQGFTAYRAVPNPGTGTTQKYLEVSSREARGGVGKCLKVNYSMFANVNGGALDLYIGDNPGAPYTELYFRWYQKVDPEWAGDDGGANFIKIMVVTLDVDSDRDFYPNGAGRNPQDRGGSDFYNRYTMFNWNGGFNSVTYPWFNVEHRDDGDWSDSDDFHNISSIRWKDYWIAQNMTGFTGNTDWHCMEILYRLNTFTNGNPNSDGLCRVWIDGVVRGELSLRNIEDENKRNAGMDYIEFFDNSSHNNSEKHWIAIDDLVVSTQYIGPDYVVGEPSEYPRNPATPEIKADTTDSK